MKRAIDIFGSIFGLVLLSPLLLAAAVLIRLRLGSPVIFRQKRAGLHGRPFIICKFRTMTEERGPDDRLLPDGKRLTKFGAFLRRTSIDELPEFWNVLKGDMSLVGPRPLYVRYIERYSPEQARRLEVKPGITGWAQVNGRNALNWEERFKMDVWYVDHQSILLDFRIMFLTVLKVLKREGISGEGHATMEEFRGTEVSDEKQDA